MSIASRASSYLRFASGLAGLRSGDVLLASFPRSGNTWVRLFLCNLISLREWDGREVDFPLLNQTMPELGVNNLLARWPHTTIPRVVKTHQRYRLVFGRKPSIGIIRDPRDVMVSYYHFTRDRKGIYSGSFAQFIRHPRYGLSTWFAHYRSWRSRWSVVVRFEDMLEDPSRELRRILEVLEVQLPDDVVEEAVARASLGALRRAESRETAKDHYGAFARSGTSGQWSTYFSDEDSAHYAELARLHGARVYV